MSASPRVDVYARITQAIVNAIEAGTGTWRMPWHHSGADVTRPTNVASGMASISGPPTTTNAAVKSVFDWLSTR